MGMGREIAETFPDSKALFEEADRILGFPLSTLCWQGPAAELTRTEFCQPALYVTSMATLAALKSELRIKNLELEPAAAAGLSLGEYTALAASGVLSFTDGLKLVRLRGQVMEQAALASAGTMASILGMEREPLEAICAETGAQIANLNAPGQIVISGPVPAVEAACQKAKEKGAKRAIPLQVGGAFHSRLMEPAALRLQKALQETPTREFQCPVASNVTGSFYGGAHEVPSLLTQQLTHAVQWEACMRTLLAGGTQTFLEVGSGSVLKGLARKIDARVPVISVGKPEEVRAAAALLRA